MPARTDQREAIGAALKAIECQPLEKAGRGLLAVLGYESDRRIPVATPKQFCKKLDPHGKLTTRERDALDRVVSLGLLFQLTGAELDAQVEMFDDAKAVDSTKIESYLFFAAELPPGFYTRTTLSTLVRAVNKPLPMPALVLFRHGDTVSLGIIHRRLHKRDRARDVLEKVTLVKDIAFTDPIRAHIEILNDFVLANLEADFGVSNFVRLHEAWQKRLGSYALSNDFYREIADWYFWAHHQIEDGTIRLPQHCDTEQEQSMFLIRLLSRVIFCWFLVEKRLIPTELFREHQLAALLNEFNPGKDPKKPDGASTYYHAVLQNLFFGTLNMPPEQRAFREKKKAGERYDKNFGITNLWRYESHFRASADWLALAARIPFLNGGLFECLDDRVGKKKNKSLLDGFSDNPKFGCHLPNDLFFGPERIVDLSRDYGEENKRSARSKKSKVRGLIEVLSRYKFTIEENTPLEEEIALDPELLGKVFENLLASYNEDTRTTARRALGAFYTPREIVSYMADEALKSYLESQVPRCKGALKDLFSDKATLREIKPGVRDALIAAIGRAKILDPACGSGAFPMGALHRLVDLLQKLDPNNESWKRDRIAEARRYRQLLEDAGAAREEIAGCDARIADTEKSFDTRFHALDFARKLYLIENVIYGVDIQPVAVQIAKLRFFISLIVDQKVDSQAHNLGVRPLPNLETRLVAADTLIPVGKAGSHLFSSEIDKLRTELAAARHEHFNARSPTAKRRWREADKAKRHEIAELLEEGRSLPRDSARMLATWDPYDQNAVAPFFDSEWMFGLPVGKGRVRGKAPTLLPGNRALAHNAGAQAELAASAARNIESGFDIVIGNPPYVRIQTLKKKNPDLVEFFKRHYVSAAKGNYDLYVVFIEAGLRLLKPDGHLAYICPHKFFSAQYGKSIRALISEGDHLRHIVHFGDEQVFKGATIYTCLLFLEKAGSTECRFVRAHDLRAWCERLSGTDGVFPAATITDAQWTFVVGKGSGVFAQLSHMPRKLGDVANVFVGLQTSADDVFILRFEGRSRKVIRCFSKSLEEVIQLESALLHPLVSGTDVGSYEPLPERQCILFPYSVGDKRATLIPMATLKRDYPFAAKYLTRNRERLAARESGKLRGKAWHGYIYLKNMTRQGLSKLCVPRLVDYLHAGFDQHGTHYLDNVDVGGVTWRPECASRSMKTLLAMLNSQVLRWFFPQISAPFRGGFLSANRQFLELLPIADASRDEDCKIETLVDILLVAHDYFTTNPADLISRDPLMLAYWERILNGMVYELYFSKEVHGAGIRMFELVGQAGLPDLDALREPGRLPQMRQLFETLHHGAHPLRVALDKLQTLDIVRIIEGKA